MGSSNGLGFGWRNTNVIKIGTSYDVTSHLTARARYSRSSQPVASTETFLNILAPGVVQDQATLGATGKTDAKTSFGLFYGHAFKTTISDNNSIPAAFGGGDANVHLAEDVVGASLGKQF
ncbi:putative long-chain fatty acid transport protein [Burkholderia sp. H160]|nr:putative long-chain fatty acid transport protein [Burkholderia sp. H160]